MRKKYKVTLLGIAILILLLSGVEAHYQMYKSEEKDLSAFIKVAEGLSINYLNGTDIHVTKRESEVAFSVTNQLNETLYYNIDILNISGSLDEVTYRLSSDNPSVSEAIGNLEQNAIASRVSIEPGVTHRYTLEILNPNSHDFSFQLEIVPEAVENSFANTILTDNDIKESTMTAFNVSATENEGLIRQSTELGNMYYFRGNVANNYVSFANNLWRIVKINEDNSVKLILNNTLESLAPMNVTELAGNNDFLTSTAYQNLTSWYTTYLTEFDELVASTYYCFDNSVSTNTGEISYLSNTRLFTDYLPSNVCGGLNVSSKVGLLTADEAVMAGASAGENTSYYLYVDGLQASWWTMTPNKRENNVMSYMALSTNGSLIRDVDETSSIFLRPVITLSRKTQVTGSGTLDDPYQIV